MFAIQPERYADYQQTNTFTALGGTGALGFVGNADDTGYILAFWKRLGWQVRLVRVGEQFGGIIRRPRYTVPTPNPM